MSLCSMDFYAESYFAFAIWRYVSVVWHLLLMMINLLLVCGFIYSFMINMSFT